MHHNRFESRSERWLARRLRAAALRDRPQFSESLHQRIMQAVGHTQTPDQSPVVAQISASEPATLRIDSQPIVAEAAAMSRPNSHGKRSGRHGARAAAWLTAAAAAAAILFAARSFSGSKNSPSNVAKNGGTASQIASAHQSPKSSRATAIQSAATKRGEHVETSIAAKPNGAVNASSAIAVAAPKLVSGISPDASGRASADEQYTFDDLSRAAKATAQLLVDELPFRAPAEEWGL